MKIRNGFVSNSSSSSFIIHRHNLTEEQDQLICAACDENLENRGISTGWFVFKTYGSLIVSTYMDNFDMGEYLAKIGVKKSKIHWARREVSKWIGEENSTDLSQRDLKEKAKRWQIDLEKSNNKAFEILKKMPYAKKVC